MAISSRNQLPGKVSAVADGAVNDEIELTLTGGARLVAIVTHNSTETLELKEGKDVIALIKAPWVTLATEDCGLKFSARNQFAGYVIQVTEGAVNATVHICTDTGFELVAVITSESQQEMKLAVDSRVIALIKVSAILIATRA
ncbi:TOBE domain-containing protein [Salmonella enterica]|uniref:TOBE domain-containing protein n=1 Tax=Salmonella sp. SAL04162 TaxID=3159782 RepID=UPI002A1EE2DD|nr:TOBE domain-containing protein [Salmonella enterica]MDJ6367538.1 TOBE domain-containing protein [Salmonella enterica]